VSLEPVTPGAASEVVNAVERARVGGVTHPEALDVAAHHLSRHHGWRYADARAFVFRLDEEL
jgi:hypothetical protein